MTNPYPTPTHSLPILKTVLYVLAVLVLVLGGFVGISLITSARSMMANFLMPLQIMGAGDIANLFTPMFTGVFINLGIVTLILSAILSVLLFATGRLLGHIAELEARLARLEALM